MTVAITTAMTRKKLRSASGKPRCRKASSLIVAISIPPCDQGRKSNVLSIAPHAHAAMLPLIYRPHADEKMSRGQEHPQIGYRHKKPRSEEHTSELQSLMRISYAVFCLKTKNTKTHQHKV